MNDQATQIAKQQFKQFSSTSTRRLHLNNNPHISISEIETLASLSSINIKEEIGKNSRSLKANYRKRYQSKAYNNKRRTIHNSNQVDNTKIWSQSLYYYDSQRNSTNQTGYILNSGAMILGTEMNYNHKKLGIFAGLGQTHIKYKLNRGHTQSKHIIIGLNATQESLRNQINYGFSLGRTKYQDYRKIILSVLLIGQLSIVTIF